MRGVPRAVRFVRAGVRGLRTDREKRTHDAAGHAVDTQAVFPGGGSGTGFAGCRRIFASAGRTNTLDNLSRKLLAYALGRSLMLLR